MDRTLSKINIGSELLTVNTSYEGLFLAYDKYGLTNVAIKAALQSIIVNKADTVNDEGLSEDFRITYDTLSEGNDSIVMIFMKTKNPVYRILVNTDVSPDRVSSVNPFECERKLTPTVNNELKGILKTVKYSLPAFMKMLMYLCDNNIGLYSKAPDAIATE